MPVPRRAAVIGAVACWAVATGYFAATGYRLDGLVPPRLPAAALLALGALAGGSYAAGYRVSPVAIIGGLVLSAPVLFEPAGAPDPSLGRGIDSLSLVIGAYLAGILVAIEYAARNPGRIRAWFTPRTIAIGVAGGVLHAVVVRAIYASVRHAPIWDGSVILEPIVLLAVSYILVGQLLVGAVTAVMLVRHRLVTPLVALTALFSWLSYRTWLSLEATRELGATPGISPQPDALYVALWFVPLTIALVLGGLEYLLRARVSAGLPGSGSVAE
ncbi:uncharacterized protein Nmag_1276 [Natrialba magadii ATCC 43099]|uniref:Uncharacterized protein n=1 Tax=Natrialba magadii (strain ATCC 43099 / DSM 3394 / CCM 3739 / CIP 104546 / IAM 13178 / JCM 8861 / NBRC 102185 / NCIMB 2190 / MS3) TaxID=547559 RepID=D3SSD0_NATMM|nr:hypothetical protein [Natrialba magadii]ADD04856.1 uncharacterized protein Nmag_1276 [Natrialba magadii ATCC 43099]ELY24441.1 hypothetical protein C500_18900 [Natrialba magadii ATCC 43099]